jgi:hypothetical protein
MPDELRAILLKLSRGGRRVRALGVILGWRAIRPDASGIFRLQQSVRACNELSDFGDVRPRRNTPWTGCEQASKCDPSVRCEINCGTR